MTDRRGRNGAVLVCKGSRPADHDLNEVHVATRSGRLACARQVWLVELTHALLCPFAVMTSFDRPPARMFGLAESVKLTGLQFKVFGSWQQLVSQVSRPVSTGVASPERSRRSRNSTWCRVAGSLITDRTQ